jgi:hypothetical protein
VVPLWRWNGKYSSSRDSMPAGSDGWQGEGWCRQTGVCVVMIRIVAFSPAVPNACVTACQQATPGKVSSRMVLERWVTLQSDVGVHPLTIGKYRCRANGRESSSTLAETPSRDIRPLHARSMYATLSHCTVRGWLWMHCLIDSCDAY